MRERASLFGLITVELLLVVGLHALARLDGFKIGWSDLSGWLENSAFEDAFGAVALVVALVLAYWLLISTLSYLAALVTARSTVLAAVAWLTLPPIRRLANRAVALSMAASTLVGPVGPAVAQVGGTSTTVVVEVHDEDRLHPPEATEPSPEDEPPSGIIVPPHLDPTPAIDTGETAEPHAGEPEQTMDSARTHTVTVRRGDHLWSLSEQHLTRVLGLTSPGDHEIAHYWVRVVQANRATIRSGNPDLIYPGEVILLPAIDAVP